MHLDEGVSPSKIKEKGNVATAMRKSAKTTIKELTTELRHKYLTILKSCYWEFFEEGQCMPESVLVLMESVDRAMDNEDSEM